MRPTIAPFVVLAAATALLFACSRAELTPPGVTSSSGNAAAIDHLVVTVKPSSVPAGEPATVHISVAVYDSLNRIVNGDGHRLTVLLSHIDDAGAGGGRLSMPKIRFTGNADALLSYNGKAMHKSTLLAEVAFGGKVIRAQAVMHVTPTFKTFFVGGGTSPYQLVFGPDGAVWFAPFKSEVGRLTTAGAVTFYPYTAHGPANAMTHGVIVGPDRHIWFTDYYGETLGRISNGKATLFQPFTNYAYTAALTSGPRGHLWVIGQGTFYETLNELTVQPKLVKAIYTNPHQNQTGTFCYDGAITVGPDGDLWYGRRPAATPNSFCPDIVRVTPRGHVTRYPMQENFWPTGATAGPDNAVWFTFPYVSRVGKVEMNGRLTTYPVPSSSFEIASSPDGTLWFSEPYVGRIANITRAGAVTEYTIPGATSGSRVIQVAGIQVASDGNIWFAEPGSDSIGELIY